MTARKIKHARMLEKRADFFKTVKEGNLAVLNKVRDQRAEEKKRLEEELKQRKIEKSQKLAAENGATPKPKKAKKAVQTHKRPQKGAFKKIAPKKES